MFGVFFFFLFFFIFFKSFANLAAAFGLFLLHFEYPVILRQDASLAFQSLLPLFLLLVFRLKYSENTDILNDIEKIL